MTEASRDRRSPPQRFRATIRKQGPNPYVDVPKRVSLAFAAFARERRIAFEGTLNMAPIRGTLIPVGRGKHRLYVNGGMRTAAQVSVGDTVSFELRATSPDVVRPPADLAATLRRAEGARVAFDALTPPHRRQLLRYIDDARTPENRARRIERIVDHVLGRRAPAERRGGERPLWTCPRCGKEFVNRNSYHSCKRHDLAEPFAGKPARIWELFERFRRIVEACGPVKVLPYRDRVGFMVRVRFAGAIPKKGWLDVGFWLPRRIDHPRMHRVETIVANAHAHLIRITEPAQLDSQIAAWLKEAYAVGCQEHLA